MPFKSPEMMPIMKIPRWSPDGKIIYFTNRAAKDYGTDCEILVSKLPM